MTAVTEPKKASKKKLEPDYEGHDEHVHARIPETLEPSKPGEPGFDWTQEYPGEEVFVFTASNGVTVGLAAMNDQRRPKPGTLRKLRFQPQVEQMWFVLECVSSDAALAVSDDFEDKDYSQMWEQWSEWSNTTAGESLRSSTS